MVFKSILSFKTFYLLLGCIYVVGNYDYEVWKLPKVKGFGFILRLYETLDLPWAISRVVEWFKS